MKGICVNFLDPDLFFISLGTLPWQSILCRNQNTNHMRFLQFLPRHSYAKRGICRRRVFVCVYVCVCVCHTPVLYQNG